MFPVCLFFSVFFCAVDTVANKDEYIMLPSCYRRAPTDWLDLLRVFESQLIGVSDRKSECKTESSAHRPPDDRRRSTYNPNYFMERSADAQPVGGADFYGAGWRLSNPRP